jgi:hypothetical protein
MRSQRAIKQNLKLLAWFATRTERTTLFYFGSGVDVVYRKAASRGIYVIVIVIIIVVAKRKGVG